RHMERGVDEARDIAHACHRFGTGSAVREVERDVRRAESLEGPPPRQRRDPEAAFGEMLHGRETDKTGRARDKNVFAHPFLPFLLLARSLEAGRSEVKAATKKAAPESGLSHFMSGAAY